MGAAEKLDSWTKEEWKAYVNEDTIERGFRCDRWGSCQYTSGMDFYDMYFHIRKDLSMEDTLDVLGCKASLKYMGTFHDVKRVLLRMTLDDLYYALTSSSPYWWDIQSQYKFFQRVLFATKHDDLFKALRSQSWDLWSAVSIISGCTLGPFIDAPDAGGVGPIYNMLQQDDNYRMGLKCALLYDLGFVKNEMSFANFDT